jgi:hypothetical protein
MDTPTPEQIAKLPAWARETIKTLQRERDVAVRTLNEFRDNDTPSPFWYDASVSTGEERGPSYKRRFVQTGQLHVEYSGAIESGSDLTRKPMDRQTAGELSMSPVAVHASTLRASFHST